MTMARECQSLTGLAEVVCSWTNAVLKEMGSPSQFNTAGPVPEAGDAIISHQNWKHATQWARGELKLWELPQFPSALFPNIFAIGYLHTVAPFTDLHCLLLVVWVTMKEATNIVLKGKGYLLHLKLRRTEMLLKCEKYRKLEGRRKVLILPEKITIIKI